MTLREVREALAAAKTRGKKASATSQTVEELESLVRRLEQEVQRDIPAKKPPMQGTAEPGTAAGGGGRRDSRRSARRRGHRRR